MSNLRSVASDVQGVVDSLGRDAGSAGSDLRDKLKDIVSSTADARKQLERHTSHGAKVVDDVVQERPYECMGVAFAAGVLLGFFILRK